jgi:hypothetical protein
LADKLTKDLTSGAADADKARENSFLSQMRTDSKRFVQGLVDVGVAGRTQPWSQKVITELDAFSKQGAGTGFEAFAKELMTKYAGRLAENSGSGREIGKAVSFLSDGAAITVARVATEAARTNRGDDASPIQRASGSSVLEIALGALSNQSDTPDPSKLPEFDKADYKDMAAGSSNVGSFLNETRDWSVEIDSPTSVYARKFFMGVAAELGSTNTDAQSAISDYFKVANDNVLNKLDASNVDEVRALSNGLKNSVLKDQAGRDDFFDTTYPDMVGRYAERAIAAGIDLKGSQLNWPNEVKGLNRAVFNTIDQQVAGNKTFRENVDKVIDGVGKVVTKKADGGSALTKLLAEKFPDALKPLIKAYVEDKGLGGKSQIAFSELRDNYAVAFTGFVNAIESQAITFPEGSDEKNRLNQARANLISIREALESTKGVEPLPPERKELP